ncbi:sensor histidine kinase [Streptomyces sp. CB02400]|uniref:sensor histidine kinase n=1 Tax=Streptomyces sp. CB02400 TaxID=1703944 RepID=UPI003FA6CA35
MQMRYLVKQLKGTKAVAQMLRISQRTVDQAVAMIEKLPEVTAAALRELKATVGLLRQDTDSQELAPAPGLDRLPQLVETCASAGLDVSVSTEGRPQALTPGLDLTAYRIIQEALTNVTKHAAAPSARVRLDYTPPLPDTHHHQRNRLTSQVRSRLLRSQSWLRAARHARTGSVGRRNVPRRPSARRRFRSRLRAPLPSSEESTS